MRFACLAFPRLSCYSSGNLSPAGGERPGGAATLGAVQEKCGKHEMGWRATAAAEAATVAWSLRTSGYMYRGDLQGGTGKLQAQPWQGIVLGTEYSLGTCMDKAARNYRGHRLGSQPSAPMRQYTPSFALVSILTQEYWRLPPLKRCSRRDVDLVRSVGGRYASQERLRVYQYFAQTGINLLLTEPFAGSMHRKSPCSGTG